MNELPDSFYVLPPHSKEWYKWFRKKQIRRAKNERKRICNSNTERI